MVAGRASWSVAQNLELVPLESEKLTSVAEAQGAIREFSQDWKTKKDTGKGRPWGPMEIGKGKGEKGKKGEWRKGGWKGDKTPAAKVEPTRPSQ